MSDPRPTPKRSPLVDTLSTNLGFDVRDIAKDVATDYAKQTLLGTKPQVRGSRYSRALDATANFLKQIWWICPLTYLFMGVAVVFVKLLIKFAEV